MYFKVLEFNNKDNITTIKVSMFNGSIFTINYQDNNILDIDIFNIISSKTLMELHDNITNIIYSYDLSSDNMFYIKEFIKWITYNMNLYHIEL